MLDNKLHLTQKRKIRNKGKLTASGEAAVQSAHTPVVGRTSWDILSVMLAALRRPAVAIPVSLVVTAAITLTIIFGVVQLTYGRNGLGITFSWPSNVRTRSHVTEMGPHELNELIQLGRELKKPYILDDVNVLIRVRDVKNGSGKERHVEWRIFYTVRALQPINMTEKLFKEKYIIAGARTMRWFGSEREIDTTDGGYQVMFDLAKGDTRTITTGATNVFDLPLENNRAVFGQRISLTPDQMFLSYENDEDVIGELSITIESDTLNLSPVGQAGKRSKSDGSLAPDEDCLFRSAEAQRSLTARWKKVIPNEEVGIHFRVK